MTALTKIEKKDIWEDFIRKYSPQSFFQSWNWGEVEKNISYGQKTNCSKIWRFGLYDQDELIAVTSIKKVFSKKGIFLHLRHGPILKHWNNKIFSLVINEIKKLAKIEKAGFIRISPLIEKTQDHEKIMKDNRFINSPLHSMDGEICCVLDLNPTEEALLASMRKTTRYLIRQAIKLGVTIDRSKDSQNLDCFIKLYDTTAKRHGFVKHSGIIDEFEALKKDDQVELYLARYQGKVLAGALIIYYQDQGIYHHGASIDQKIPASYLLQWEAIKEAKKRNMSVYNFWGVARDNDNNNHPWKGLTLFKKGFGGRLVEYQHAQDLPLQASYWLTYGVEKARKVIKGY